MAEPVAFSYLNSTKGITSPIYGTFEQNQTSPDYTGDGHYPGYKACYFPKYNLTDACVLWLSNPKANGTFEMWMKLDSWGWSGTTANGTPPAGATPIFVTDAHGNPFGDQTKKSVNIYFIKGTGLVYGLWDGTTTLGTITNLTIVQNTWYHWAMTWDDANNRVILYLDGIEVGRHTSTINSTPYTGTHVYIGGLRLDYSIEYSAKAWIDGVQHYDVIKTSFQDRFNLRPGMKDSVAGVNNGPDYSSTPSIAPLYYWRFEDVLTPAVGGTTLATEGSGTTYSTSFTPFGKGITFNGSGSVNATSLVLPSSFTAQFWFYNTGTNAYRRWFINQNGALAGNNTEIFLRESNTGYVQFYAMNGAVYVTDGTIAIVRNTWEHWAITADQLTTPGSTIIKLYKNGVEVATKTFAAVGSWRTGIWMGGYYTSGSERSIGTFDELKIYNYVKTNFDDRFNLGTSF